MYKIKAVNPIKNDIKKLRPKVSELIQKHHLPLIKEDPHQAENL